MATLGLTTEESIKYVHTLRYRTQSNAPKDHGGSLRLLVPAVHESPVRRGCATQL